MQHWREIVNRSPSKKSDHSKKSSEKFNPKRAEKSSSNTQEIFYNRSISRIQNSFIESQLHNRSRSASRVSSDIKNYSPKTNLRKSQTRNYLKRGSTGELAQMKDHVKEKVHSLDYGNNHLQVEITNLKRKFNKFKEEIKEEIKRQQKILKEMYEKIISKMQQIQKSIQSSKQFSTLESSNKLILSLNKEQNSKLSKSENMMESLKQNPLKFQKKQRSSYETPESSQLFGKFFQAMKVLKSQMKQIGNLSHFILKQKQQEKKSQIPRKKFDKNVKSQPS